MKVLYKTPLVLEGQGGKSEGGDTGIMSLLQSGKSKTDTADAKYQPEKIEQMTPNGFDSAGNPFFGEPTATNGGAAPSQMPAGYTDSDHYGADFTNMISKFF
jgi:hypothetical protein